MRSEPSNGAFSENLRLRRRPNMPAIKASSLPPFRANRKADLKTGCLFECNELAGSTRARDRKMTMNFSCRSQTEDCRNQTFPAFALRASARQAYPVAETPRRRVLVFKKRGNSLRLRDSATSQRTAL